MKILFKKYKELPLAVKASMWYSICSILQKGILLITTPVFTRLMSTSEYGIYTIYQSWYAIFTIFMTLNLYASVYNNGLTKYPQEERIMTSSFQGLSTVITVFFFIVYIIGKTYWNKKIGLTTILMMTMFGQLLVEPALNFWMVRQRYNYQYKGVIAVTLVNTFLSTLIGIVVVSISVNKGIARVLSYAIVQILVGAFFYCKQLFLGKKAYSGKYWLYALKFNIPLIPHYLSYSILNQADRIMISSMVGTSEAAMYSVAYTIAMMMQIINQAISNSLTPYTYRSLKKEEFIGLRENCSLILKYMTVICILVMLFSPEVLRFFAAKEYMDAVYVMPPVVASTFFMFLYSLFSNIEFYFERTKYIMVASSIGAVLNIILNYVFIRIYGYYAAGYTTLFCYIMFVIAHYFFYKKVIKKEIANIKELYNSKLILWLSVVVVLNMIICLCIYQYIIFRYSLIICLLILIVVKNHRSQSRE